MPYVPLHPDPPATTLLSTDDLLALRVNGKPRDPENGRHREVVIFTAPTMSAGLLAAHLRDAAGRLDLLAGE